MTDAAQSLNAARAVDSLLNAARDLMNDAEGIATDGGLPMLAFWIRDRIESLNGQLLVEVRATVAALEQQQANKSDPKS
jgi:hypothetical protein